MIEEQFLTRSKFTKIVEETVLDKTLSYMDAVLYICEKNSIDPEDVKKFISPIIKGKNRGRSYVFKFPTKTKYIVLIFQSIFQLIKWRK